RLERCHVPLIDAVLGDAVEPDLPVRPWLHGGPLDAIVKVARLPRREMIDEAWRATRAAGVHAYAHVAVRHPFLRIDDFPVLVTIARAVRDVGMLGDHALPRARVAVLESEPLGVRAVAQQHGIVSRCGWGENVGPQDAAIVHRDRHVPIDAYCVPHRRPHRPSCGNRARTTAIAMSDCDSFW